MTSTKLGWPVWTSMFSHMWFAPFMSFSYRSGAPSLLKSIQLENRVSSLVVPSPTRSVASVKVPLWLLCHRMFRPIRAGRVQSLIGTLTKKSIHPSWS